MNPVQLLTVKAIKTLYKDGEPASSIELIEFEELAYQVVSQKDLHTIGKKSLYVMPDYCLPIPEANSENSTKSQEFFKEFTAPGGEAKRTKLGKNGRIRAIKFNFNLEGSVDPVYSNGILLPLNEVAKAFNIDEELLYKTSEESLVELLEITKYVEPETAYSGLSKGDLPTGMYSTDETNIETLVNKLNWPLELVGTLKNDGSSITVYYKNEEEHGVCSRNLEKKLDQLYVSGYETEIGETVRKHYDKELSKSGWMLESSEGLYFYETPQESWKEVTKEVDDTFVKLGKPVLEYLKDYCKGLDMQLALRGELCGNGLKGSGNKNNPHSNLPQHIAFYGVDDYSTGVTRKVGEEFFSKIIIDLGLQRTEVLLNGVFTYETLKVEAERIFKDKKEKGQLIEGIVCRTLDHKISFKVMNFEYDSKK